jgi:hypothetical protein
LSIAEQNSKIQNNTTLNQTEILPLKDSELLFNPNILWKFLSLELMQFKPIKMYPVGRIKENVKIRVDTAEKVTKEHPRVALTTEFIAGSIIGLSISGLGWVVKDKKIISYPHY